MSSHPPSADPSVPRSLILIDTDTHPAATGHYLWERAGLRVTNLADVASGDTAAAALHPGGRVPDGYLLPRLGVAVVYADAEQVAALHDRSTDYQPWEHGGVLAVEPERPVWAATADDDADELAIPDEWRTRRTGTISGPQPGSWDAYAPVVGYDAHPSTGAGVRVAVLDTGIDPDDTRFADRLVYASTVVPGASSRDVSGHGTHLAAIVATLAPDADLFSCKVLADPVELPAEPGQLTAGRMATGRGLDGYLLSGIEWALAHGVDIALLPVAGKPYSPPSHVFEYAARRAMDQGLLIIAAAGNDSDRGAGLIEPVAHPANCSAIVAVGAVEPGPADDLGWRPANYSNGGVGSGPGGQVDLAAHGGSDKRWLASAPHGMTGTSVAAAYTTGVAAVVSGDTLARGWELYGRLLAGARRMHHPSVDLGAGIAYADTADPGTDVYTR